MYESEFKVTKDNILKHITQEEIFEKYLGVRVTLKKKIRNPKRSDKTPGCSFYWNGNKLRFRDPALPLNEDCFGLVMKLNRCDFQEALELIAFEFGLSKETKSSFNPISLSKEREESHKKTILTPIFNLDDNGNSKWRKEELLYWEQYHITPELLKEFKVFSINGYYINGKLRYTYKPSDIGFCYGQYEDEERVYKIYHPNRTFVKFIATMKQLDGYNDLPERGDLLVITKSRKDRMCLAMFGILAIAPQAEGNYISDDILGDLDARFDTILVFFDFDKTGIIGANRLKRSYNWQPIFLTDGRFYTEDYKAKDFSEFVKINGIGGTQYLIDYAKEELL
jgi:hypothetical protein